MKKFLALLFVALSLMVSTAYADGDGLVHNAWNDAVYKAQALKKAGDFAGAAAVTPRTLCAAIYYWNAACKVVGHLDDSNDWAINDVLTVADKTEGLRLLGLSAAKLAESKTPSDSNDDGTCSTVDPNYLKTLINKVTVQINKAPIEN